MKTALATSFAFYLKAHNYHWNVQGAQFSEFHKFFGEIYTEVFSAIDQIAEQIRVLDSFVPGSLQRFKELSTITDEYNVPSAIVMVQRLQQDNQRVIDDLTYAYLQAEKDNQYGLANFLQDRIDVHNKYNWMLKAYQK